MFLSTCISACTVQTAGGTQTGHTRNFRPSPTAMTTVVLGD